MIQAVVSEGVITKKGGFKVDSLRTMALDGVYKK